MKTVFLGGTCANSLWRDALIPKLNANITAFNPVVPNWNAEAQKREDAERASNDYVLYCITPASESIYSAAEVVEDSNKRPERTLLVVIHEDLGQSFSAHQVKAWTKIGKLVTANGARVLSSLDEVAEFLNAQVAETA